MVNAEDDEDIFGERQYIVEKHHIQEFRRRILQEIEKEPDLYYEDDAWRMRVNDDWCRRYVRHKRLNIDDAIEMAKNSLKWRKEFGVLEINEKNVYELYFNIGCFFPFGHDRWDSQIIMFRTKVHRKNEEKALEMKRFLVFWCEKLLVEQGKTRITFIFDCADSSYVNMDMDQIYFIVEVFREYYPWSIGHLIVYDMPWLYKACWTAIKAVIPSEGVERIKFLTRDDIHTIVDPSQLPAYMGGTKSLPFRDLSVDDINQLIHDPNLNVSDLLVSQDSIISMTPEIKAFYRDNFKLDFDAPVAPPVSKRTAITNGVASNGGSHFDDAASLSRRSDRSSKGTALSTAGGDLLICTPRNELRFPVLSTDYSGEISTSVIYLQNMSNDVVIFKVKANCIRNYRVRPFAGSIGPQQNMEIIVEKLPGSMVRGSDKLLVQAIPIDCSPDHFLTIPELNDRWNSASKSDMVEFRLRCVAFELSSMDEMRTISQPTGTTPSRGVGGSSDDGASSSRRTSRERLLTAGDHIAAGPPQPHKRSTPPASKSKKSVQLRLDQLSRRQDSLQYTLYAILAVLVVNFSILIGMRNCLSSPDEWYC